MTEIEQKIVAYVRAHPGCRSKQMYQALHGHVDCPPCCTGYLKGPAREALPRLIERGVIVVGIDWDLKVRDTSA